MQKSNGCSKKNAQKFDIFYDKLSLLEFRRFDYSTFLQHDGLQQVHEEKSLPFFQKIFNK
ncbi:hypothetical protein BpHYR1_012212 [Brachionus plicatilis]|uniref:Uncharacterized protein n=1 Tax=Brachionus plicatilis TaxID=10195 RepID=A0A3M7RE91_BRAPC|nr:hypothetical protein BpHYR1_012212 [Brachionus plicatilis]